VLVGFRKKGSGSPSLTWPESVDEALCFGWIDSIRRRIDDDSYSNRFTPRKRGSSWSARNVQRVGELRELGLMTPAGLTAFEAREEGRTGQYSYEQAPRDLEGRFQARLRRDAAAWRFWQAQSPSYRRAASFWVMSPKQASTRERRIETLIEDCAAARPIKPMRYGRSA
jgi:uncharacterized protein YdeI (YjbR/CyaY-like superfamily)